MTFLKNSHVKFATLFFGSAALVALVSATPIAPAYAQSGSAPAGLLRLDYSQQYFQSHDSSPFAGDAAVQLTDQQRARVNRAYARARKSQLNH